MIFGKIDYLNLLPFHVFLKRSLGSTQLQSSIHYKRGVPSAVNRAFKERRIDAAFISSIESRPYTCLNAGIVAFKEVRSVLVLPGAVKKDSASATSNALAKQLHIQGEVIIGDRALRHFLATSEGVDLARAWYEKHGLPFVFARLCYHGKKCYWERLITRFLARPVKIPYYVLKKASLQSGIPISDICDYLTKISYRIGPKEQRALKKFLYPKT